MNTVAWEVRGTECMKYCQTRENCAYACGLEPLNLEEEYNTPVIQKEQDRYPIRFVIVPKNISSLEKETVYTR